VKVLLVAVLGAAGAVSRYGIGTAVGSTTFPWPTLAINVAGCLALGVVLAVGPGRWSPEVTTGIGVGFLGGFTTFSAFGAETQALLRDERLGAAAAYVALSVLLGVAAAYAGTTLGRSLVD
jgi:CrcB protein